MIHSSDSVVSRAVTQLASLGLVEIGIDPHERRRHIVCLTARGEQAAAKIAVHVKKIISAKS